MANQTNYVQKLIDQIMTMGKFAALPEAEEMAFRKNLEMQFNRRLGIIIMQNLPEAGIKEFESLQKDGQPDPLELQKILEKYIPDYEVKIKVGMEEFVKEVILTLSK